MIYGVAGQPMEVVCKSSLKPAGWEAGSVGLLEFPRVVMLPDGQKVCRQKLCLRSDMCPLGLQSRTLEGRTVLGDRARRAEGASFYLPESLAREAGLAMFTRQCGMKKGERKENSGSNLKAT